MHARCQAACTTLIGVAVALVLAGSSVSAPPVERIVFFDDFNADVVGAVPVNLAWPGVPVVLPQVGWLFGGVSSPSSKVHVTWEAGGSEKVIRLSDISVPSGTGNSELTIVPSSKAGPGLIQIEFDLHPIIVQGEELVLSVIDNRSTPGTGLVARAKIGTDGRLTIGQNPVDFWFFSGNRYHVALEVMLSNHGSDKWSVDITPAHGTPFHSETQHTHTDATEVTSVQFGTSLLGNGAYGIDDLKITVLD